MSASMSAVGGLSGLVVLTLSFVDHDPLPTFVCVQFKLPPHENIPTATGQPHSPHRGVPLRRTRDRCPLWCHARGDAPQRARASTRECKASPIVRTVNSVTAT